MSPAHEVAVAVLGPVASNYQEREFIGATPLHVYTYKQLSQEGWSSMYNGIMQFQLSITPQYVHRQNNE